MIALRSFVGARENCRRFDVALPASFDERLSRACDFAHHMRRPDGTIPALSDSDTGDYAELLRSPRACSRATTSRARRRAARASRDGGYFVQRAGELYLIFDCGPLGDGGHGHYDALSIEAWAGEQPLVLDPGRFTYAEGEPNLRHWFRGTAAHNTVTVDGADQTPYARSRSSLPSAEATFLGRDDARRPRHPRAARSARPVYEAVHRRRVIFVDGAYWLIEDVLTGTRAPPLRPALAPPRHATPVHPARQGRAQHRGGGRLDLAPQYGLRHAAPVVSAVATGERARFVTLLAPDERMLELDGDVARVGGDTIVLGERVTRR